MEAGKRVDFPVILMYRLDRNTLEITDKTFIRQILEYEDVHRQLGMNIIAASASELNCYIE